MKKLFFILFGCFFYQSASAQSTKGLTHIPDTSFTIHSVWHSVKKTHPEASLVTLKNLRTIHVERDIVYKTTGRRKLVLDVFMPPTHKMTRPRSAIIIVHGGGWRSGNRTMHYPLAERLADLGYVCFTPEYRLSTESLYPAALNDVKAVVSWVRENAMKYNINEDNIAIAGHSAGGQLAALVPAANYRMEYGERNVRPTHVNAIINIDGIVAFIHPESGEGDDSKKTSAATNWLGYTKKEKPEVWKDASPLTHLSPRTPPTLFINSSVARMHAGRDDYINILNNWDIYSEIRTFENAPHVFPFFDPWFEPMVQQIDGFIKKVFSPNVPIKIIVAKDGSGDYTSLQPAFDAVYDKLRKPFLIYVRNGIYSEKLFVDSARTNVTLLGEDKFKTIIRWNDHSGKISPAGDTINTRTSWSFKVNANNFTAKNITFQNDAGFTAGQAVAVESNGDMATFINCRFIGNQDVLFLNNDSSRQYFENCYIEGTTDFIFGSSTAWFEKCHIHSKKNSHITAASTPKEKAFGYVFNDCMLTGDTSLRNVSLGRPWRPFAHVIYMNSYIGPHIKAEGWANWNNTENYLTTRYAEYNNYGPGANISGRVKWVKQLSEEESKRVTVHNVLNGWNPDKD